MTTSTSKLIVVSGPSGAGKTSVVGRLLEECDFPIRRSVSATTREPRKGEKDHVDYHFLSAEEFKQKRLAGDFLECCEVFGKGCWYGTLREEVESGLQAGQWVLLEIDVQGALEVMQKYPDAVTIFIRPESMEELERRLRERGTETEPKIQRRLSEARRELARKDHYRHDVINDDFKETVDKLKQILQAEACGAGL